MPVSWIPTTRLVDSYNQTISSLPALTRGMRAELILKLLDAEVEALDGDLSAYASWDFVIADDWNTATPSANPGYRRNHRFRK